VQLVVTVETVVGILPVRKSTELLSLGPEPTLVPWGLTEKRPGPKPLDWLKIAQLPGHGEPGTFCGQSMVFQCKECGQPFWTENQCQERQCPSCYEAWTKEQGRAAADRVWFGSRIVAENQNYRRYRVVHCAISWAERSEDHDIVVVRDRARSIAKEHGIRGGLLILHPWRQDEDLQFVPDGYIHVHIIGVADGEIKPGDGKDYIFKHIPNPKTGDYRGFRRVRDVAAGVRYLLTHAAIVKSRHALTWFGVLSYNAMPNQRIVAKFPDVQPDVEKFGPQCPHCGSRRTMYAVIMNGQYHQQLTWQDGPGPP